MRLYAVILCLLLPCSAYAQASLPITVRLKSGESIKADFLKADTKEVQVQDSTGVRVIKLHLVAVLEFAPPSVANGEAREAVRALQKLVSATEAGMNYREYGTRLADTKAAVDEATRALSDKAIKTSIVSAMDAFLDAGSAWDFMIRLRVSEINVTTEYGAALQKKYSIPITSQILKEMDRNAVLSAIWKEAGKRTAEAQRLIDSVK